MYFFCFKMKGLIKKYLIFISISVFAFLITSYSLVNKHSENINKIKKVTTNKQDLEDAFIQVEIKKVESVDKFNYVNRYRNFQDCSTNYAPQWQSDANQLNESYNYSKTAAESTFNDRIVRGIIVYYPVESLDHFAQELRWLYRSWIEMLKYEPEKWRTDLIIFINKDDPVFHNNKTQFLDSMNCKFINKRESRKQKPMCSLVHYESVKKRTIIEKRFENKNELYNYLLHQLDIYNDDPINLAPFYKSLQNAIPNYGYLDSIMMAFDGYQYFKTSYYDFLIRSDMDVFLSPTMAKWLPRYCNDFYVGRSGYSHTFNRNRLKRVANNLGLSHANDDNLGSTWYSTPSQFRIVSYLTLFNMMYLAEEEFTTADKTGKVGTVNWPEWHYGVSLYIIKLNEDFSI
jgi:hypothetical protein